jgi:hypothetical protein
MKQTLDNAQMPIKITENEILYFGFTKSTRQWSDFLECYYVEYSLGDFAISSASYSVSFKGCFIKQLKYVHELQNLYFAIIGEELTSDNKS